MAAIQTEIEGHVLKIALNRPDKMNAFTVAMLEELAAAYTQLEDTPSLRCAVLYAHGDHFTGGLDLAQVAGHLKDKQSGLFGPGQVDPVQLHGRKRTKPVVIAVHGYCLTIGIELLLAADIAIAAPNTKFGQIEIKRGIFPFGGATIRMQQRCGWGNAMRYLLTGDLFDGQEALRIGMVQELHEQPALRAFELAQTIASQAPLGVQATLVSAYTTIHDGEQAAADQLYPTIYKLMATDDAKEGVQSFVERRQANFKGK